MICDKCGKNVPNCHLYDAKMLCVQCEHIAIINARQRELYNQKVKTLPKTYQQTYHTDDEIKGYANNNVFIYGKITRTGKTALAIDILKYQWARGMSGRYIYFPTWIRRYVNSKHADKLSMFNELIDQKGLLIIDDLGGDKIEMGVALPVINDRLMDRRQTILISNLSLEELGDLDDRLAARIKEECILIARK